MRKADKPQVAEAIVKYTKHFDDEKSDNVGSTKKYFLDGGFPIHRISWCNSDTLENIAMSQVNFSFKRNMEQLSLFLMVTSCSLQSSMLRDYGTE